VAPEREGEKGAKRLLTDQTVAHVLSEARGLMNGRRPRTLISYQSVAAAAFYPMISPRCH